MVKTLSLSLALAFTLTWAHSASAQPASSKNQSTAQQARRLFDDGVTLAKSERWAEALWAFRRSRGLMPRPSTSYNIANALYRLDRPVEGLAELDRYDEMPGVVANGAAQMRGTKLRDLLEKAAAQVRLAITPADAEVYVDGRLSKDKGSDRVIHLNPGPHSLRISREGYEPTKMEVQVERGSRETRAIALRPTVSSRAARTALPTVAVELPKSEITRDPMETGPAQSQAVEDDRKPFVKRPGFWAMIGAIAAVGIGVGVAVALTRKDDAPPCGTTGTCATTQGLTVTSF